MGWGLFRTWYDWVEETNNGLGDITVVCKEPGFIKCKAQPADFVFQGNPSPLTDESYDAIESYIYDRTTSDDFNGRFIYNGEYYITYVYDSSADRMTMDIYSIEEAQDLGLL